MHDAAEAYLVDLPKPIKEEIKQYKDIEDGLIAVIAIKFGFPFPFPNEIHAIDKAMLELEWDEIFLKNHSWYSRFKYTFRGWFAKEIFLHYFSKYKN